MNAFRTAAPTRPGTTAPGVRGPEDGPAVHRIAIVGSGPRGLSVLERLAARLAAEPPAGPVEIHLIDAVRVGCGRIWDAGQPRWFMMNTVAGEVSAFSGPPDGGPDRPGAGPSLAQWWARVDPDCPGPNGYAPRALHGRYMLFVLECVLAALPGNVRLLRIQDTVLDLEPVAAGFRLELARGGGLEVDRCVLVTGHARPELTGTHAELARFAEAVPGLRYIRGDSPADMPLDEVPAGSPVGVLGLGLSFYDVMAAFTEGRGGTYEEDGCGGLRYVPGGREPLIVAGSRSGMPLPGRGRNQKHPDYTYTPLLFSADSLRARQAAETCDFRAEVLPWLVAEAELVYYTTALRAEDRAEDARILEKEAVARAADGPPPMAELAARHGLGDLPGIDLEALARPFAGRTFAGPAAFREELLEALRRDVAHAVRGNVGSPLKAALDVLRDTRGLVRLFVDYGALSPRSHREDFVGWYAQRIAFLAAGPPLVRIRQVVALIEAGVLRIVGPATRFAPDPAAGRFELSSPQVAGSRIHVDTLIDARTPVPDVRRDPAPLTRRLVERGLWNEFVNGDGPDAFATGGVAVGGSPYHPLDRDGRPVPGLYVLGIPTEHTRWFMQAGSSRPGFWTDFVRDADAIAADALAVPADRPSADRTAVRA